jgi:ParB-like chromosome segregation protein Spo0J
MELLRQDVDMGRLAVVADEVGEESYLLADGFHRLEAMRRLGRTMVDVMVYPGTRDDAVLLACELNAQRGLQYSIADKRKVAERYLHVLSRRGQNPSDNEVARRLGFSRRTIERACAELKQSYDLPAARDVIRGGTTYLTAP